MQTMLLESLSDRLLHQDIGTWRDVFLGDGLEAVRFENAELTLLCTDAPCNGWTRAELSRFAARCGGFSQPAGHRHALCAFAEPRDALAAALRLQKLSPAKLRTAITAGACTVAVFEREGATCRIVLPPHDAMALMAVRRAAPGSVVISSAAYESLEPHIAAQAGDALVVTEFDEESVGQASITLPPQRNEALSTFAGLGLT
jgi:class 3 adenylate cyclase